MKRNLDIQKEWESIGASFSATIGLPLLSVPKNYFETLPEQILAGIKATTAPDVTLEKIDLPFEVPKVYFEQLDTQILAAVLQADTIIQDTAIKGLSKSNVFMVPGQYFEHFAQDVLAQLNQDVSVDDELEASPLLKGLKGSNPFEQAPQVEIVLPKSTTTEKPDIEVPMTVRKSLRWSNWMAAASVAVFFILGAGWLHLNNNNAGTEYVVKPSSDQVSKRLAALSDDAIEAYVDQHIDDFNEYMLEANVSNVSSNKSVEKTLNKISDEELEAYMYNELY